MPEGFEIIRSRVKDDIPVLIDRILRSKQKEVVLVLPKNSIIIVNPDSLKILKQEAESVNKILSINTESAELKSLAKKFGIITYDSHKIAAPIIKPEIKMKRMMDIVPPSLPKIEPLPEPEPELEPVEPEEPMVYETKYETKLEKDLENFYASPVDIKNNKKWLVSFKSFTVFLVILGGFSLAATLYLALPKAEIKIALRKFKIDAAIPVMVSKNIGSSNLTNGIVPGEYFILSKTGSKTFSTEGIKKEVSLKSRGFITIFNAYSAAPQKLVAQTRFETKDGKIFRLKAPIVIPGAKVIAGKLTPSSIKAEVVADAAGEEYNIGPSYFTIPGFKSSPKYAGFYAKSAENMVSGKVGSASIITQEEIENAKKNLASELAKELEDNTLNTFKDSSDFRLIKGASSVKIDEFKSSVSSGSFADSFTVNMKITWQAVFFREQDIRALVSNYVSLKNRGLDAFQFKGSINYPEADKIDFKKGELFFTLKINQENAFDADINNLKKELSGLNEDEMRKVISEKPFINSAAISLWPFWVKKSPTNLDRVNISIDK